MKVLCYHKHVSQSRYNEPRVYTFDEICESQDFNHEHEFVDKQAFDRVVEALNMCDKGMVARFWSKVKVLKKRQCWEWLSCTSPNGYGKFSIGNYPHSAHVFAFKFFNGAIPEGMVVDHICRNRLCVNPTHLRTVSPKVNVLENSQSIPAKHIVKTHCPVGHEYNFENTRLSKNKSGSVSRHCRVCQKIRNDLRKKTAREALKDFGVEV